MRFDLITRADGRRELVCPHGCGHPSKVLTIAHGRRWHDWMDIHGCDGCCSSPEFATTEAELVSHAVSE